MHDNDENTELYNYVEIFTSLKKLPARTNVVLDQPANKSLQSMSRQTRGDCKMVPPFTARPHICWATGQVRRSTGHAPATTPFSGTRLVESRPAAQMCQGLQSLRVICVRKHWKSVSRLHAHWRTQARKHLRVHTNTHPHTFFSRITYTGLCAGARQ